MSSDGDRPVSLPDRARALLDTWFGPPGDPERERHRDIWFKSTAEFDASLRNAFLADYEAGSAGELRSWEALPEGALALVLLLDQIPRNIFRGTPRAYASDAAARAAANRALARGFDRLVPEVWRRFFYMPYSPQRESRRPAALGRAVRCSAARPRSSWCFAPLRATVCRGHRALWPLSASQRNPWPEVDPGRDRSSR